MEELAFTVLGAVSGTVIGIFSTLFIQWLGVKSRVKHEDLKIHSEKLSIERLKIYPQLYKMLSESVKHLHFPRMYSEKFDLKQFENCLNDWDSKNGYLLTEMSGDRAFYLRELIRAKIEGNEFGCRKMVEQPGKFFRLMKRKEKIIKQPPRIPTLDDLKFAMVELEIGLRVDLKVYSLEYFTVRLGFRAYYPSYTDTSKNTGSIDSWLRTIKGLVNQGIGFSRH